MGLKLIQVPTMRKHCYSKHIEAIYLSLSSPEDCKLLVIKHYVLFNYKGSAYKVPSKKKQLKKYMWNSTELIF